MTRKLTEANIGDICGLLDGWRGPLTWEGLIAGTEGLTKVKYTRQALSAHERIARAFRVRKNVLNSLPDTAPRGSVELRAAEDRIARLEGQVARLIAENTHLMETFVRWAYNASTRGIDESVLNAPLPAVDRELTKAPARRRR